MLGFVSLVLAARLSLAGPSLDPRWTGDGTAIAVAMRDAACSKGVAFQDVDTRVANLISLLNVEEKVLLGRLEVL